MRNEKGQKEGEYEQSSASRARRKRKHVCGVY